MAKAKGLGRGLDALFGPEEPAVSAAAAPVGIPLRNIEPNPNQPRRNFDEEALAELAESIRENGVITPVTLRKTGDTYQIIAGERRWRAARMAGLTELPALVLDVTEGDAYAMAMVENLQREDLNPMEEAEGYQALMNLSALTQEQVAQKVGKSRPSVANALRLLNLPEQVSRIVRAGGISAGHGRALLGLKCADDMEKAAYQVMQQGLTVRQTEDLVKNFYRTREKAEKQTDIYVRQLERDMSASTGHKITINHGAKKGRLVVEYYGNEDLEAVCAALKQIRK